METVPLPWFSPTLLPRPPRPCDAATPALGPPSPPPGQPSCHTWPESQGPGRDSGGGRTRERCLRGHRAHATVSGLDYLHLTGQQAPKAGRAAQAKAGDGGETVRGQEKPDRLGSCPRSCPDQPCSLGHVTWAPGDCVSLAAEEKGWLLRGGNVSFRGKFLAYSRHQTNLTS